LRGDSPSLESAEADFDANARAAAGAIAPIFKTSRRVNFLGVMRGVYTTRFGQKFSKITESRQGAELPQTVSAGRASNN